MMARKMLTKLDLVFQLYSNKYYFRLAATWFDCFGLEWIYC